MQPLFTQSALQINRAVFWLVAHLPSGVHLILEGPLMLAEVRARFCPTVLPIAPKPITQQTASAKVGIWSTKSTALRWLVFGSASAHKVEWTRPALLAAPALRRFRSPGH
jgi:hypothetical protein